MLAALLLAGGAGAALAYALKRLRGSAFLPTFLLLISYSAAATALFVSGGRTL
ncbi:hypothetical protein FHR83_002439 [Actinoplanes campanulatus]|uniref:Uncharacterized protein n=1 Tax=Actinoplanes campanulatus TaxID=113559 RepID=A0A7W5AEV6_9ACTN|nr:hypothetical protein [Actinoplanes campanulatus]MBB3094776.1 hypothetical protein [Actinoplanes campanulatus]